MSGSQTSGSAVYMFKESLHPKALNPSLICPSIHENSSSVSFVDFSPYPY